MIYKAFIFILLAAPAFAQYVPPVGVKMPSTGDPIASPPAVTRTVTSFPTTTAPGEVIAVQPSGTTLSSVNVNCGGTAASPSWIVLKPGLAASGVYMNISGSHCRVLGNGLKITSTGTNSGGQVTGNGVMVRDVEFQGGGQSSGNNAGLGVQGTDITLFRIKVHHYGQLVTTTDIDFHGISAGVGTQRFWLLDSEIYSNGGDGLQLNPYPYTGPNLSSMRFLYVGRTKAHDNRQVGFGLKGGQDVFFSENEVWNHRASVSSGGEGIDYQYSSQRVWFLYNNIHDSTQGIAVRGDNINPPGEDWAIGNTFANINVGALAIPASNCGGGAWGCAVIGYTGGATHHAVGNSATNHSGRGIAVGRGVLRHKDNPGLPISNCDTTCSAELSNVNDTFFNLYGLDISGGATDPNPTPTPTPTPTPAPTPTPTPVPTPTPTPVPTPTPTPVPTPTPTPSPSPTPSPTPTPTPSPSPTPPPPTCGGLPRFESSCNATVFSWSDDGRCDLVIRLGASFRCKIKVIRP